ncbi:FKBP-type peptidyl-prolyl cis-trans isomerase [Marinitenerispora sediminis]|uniref:peptidylprolyl isomerase n=1 Tax=Marinitenerispora sediminis TaxID=1931232 RepID=A0A368T7V7_9ACTN|nr:FKBP-type peptidyl-prolyl cis-trans isomerase [Marinitenerispora sediminis]RCV51150.1 peptidylprolyl isomerase [Marinitenerispora sediminis]RCV57055.1 peptidylprolyl isomerase [Marinitenerispora sediminis]RCV59944.1 peptidylprolyl isomerase [Marinitenerispora sediminis]
MRRSTAAALVVPFSALLLATSSCGVIPEDWRTPAFLRSEEELDERLPTVTGDLGEEPDVSFPDIAPPDEQISGVVTRGSGENDLVRADDLLLADIVDYQWTGEGEAEQTQSTYETGAPVLLQLEQMTDELRQDLVDQPVGSRVVYVFPASEQQAAGGEMPTGASVSIVDIRGRYGKGDTVPGEQATDGGGELPTVADNGHEAPDISIPDNEPPADLEAVDLIEGDGPEVEEGQQLVVQYTGVTWSDGEVFDSTWSRAGAPATFQIGVGAVIEGWDQGLVGRKVGSRVLLAIPEELAYDGQEGAPQGALVFVVDLLAAVDGQPPAEEPPAEGEESPQ